MTEDDSPHEMSAYRRVVKALFYSDIQGTHGPRSLIIDPLLIAEIEQELQAPRLIRDEFLGLQVVHGAPGQLEIIDECD
jgi:hypothetical protein